MLGGRTAQSVQLFLSYRANTLRPMQIYCKVDETKIET